MDGIDERSERKAKELEDEAWEMARNGGIPKVNGYDSGSLKPKTFNFGADGTLSSAQKDGQAHVNFILGAICGDVIGSVYEFHNVKRKDFELFSPETTFTDDSVLTVATMEALVSGESADDYTRLYQLYGRKYTNRGYGNRFQSWIDSSDPKPYESWGNGSAMRASPIGWAFDTVDEVMAEAEKSASVSHNHSEGIKGAQAAALAVFLARNGISKLDIKLNIKERIGYDLDRTCDEIRTNYSFNESCQGTVPEAIIAFLESTDYEDAIRLAVSLGGDSDTLACITGGIAEAYYCGVPEPIASKVRSLLPGELLSVIDEFSEKYRGKLKDRMKAAETYAAQGVEYLTPDHAWLAVEKFASALEFISNVMTNAAEEKRIEWLILRADARRLRQWYDLAVEDYETALQKMGALPRVRQALLQISTVNIEEKINATAREGVSFYPGLAKYLDNKKEDDK
jgi:ADP-ribosylglycohydrolase